MRRHFAIAFLPLVLLAPLGGTNRTSPIHSCSTCYGYDPCSACHTCELCKHCNAGGTCGVCLDPPRTVSGKVTLIGSINLAQPVTLIFRQGYYVKTYTVLLGRDGSFSVTDLPHKVYTLHVKGDK